MTKRQSESGNIFFMLFGAVALVGVVAASTSTLMRGPLSTVVNVNARAKADTQMQIAAKLAMVRASQQALSGDCDADGNIEPIPALDASPKPAGGGQIPASIGASQKDPWGNAYGYCVWDIGTKNADGACTAGAGEVTRLKGDYNNNYPVMVIVSSGPDRVFQTQCNDWNVDPSHAGSDPNVNNYPDNFVGTLPGQHLSALSGDVIFKPINADDIVISYTYDQASQVAGGLWSLMKTDPNKITTNKDVDIQTNANFASGKTATFQGAANFDAGSRLDLGFGRGANQGGLFKLPDNTALPDSSCSVANDGALRLNVSGTHNALQICDGRSAPPTWVDPSASGMSVTKIDDLSDAVASFSSQSKNLVLGDGSGLNFTSTSAGHNNVLLGVGSASALSAAGADNVILGSNTATSLTTGSHNIILGSNINVAASTSNSLNIGNLIYGTGMTGTGTTSAGNVGIGTATPNVKLEVAGSVQATQFQFNSSNALAMSGGDITLSYGGVSQLFVNGNGLGVGISPTHKLDVDGDAYGQRFISTFSSASTLPGFAFGGDITTGIAHPSGSTIGFTLGGSEKARLTSTGLGIGVSSPSVALDVVGAGAFSSYVSAVTSFNFGSANGMYNQAGNISLNTGGSPRVYVTSGGLGVGLATPMVSIDAAGAIRPGMMITCDSTTHGAIRYGSGDALEYCSTDNSWYSLVASGGGGGSANLWTNNTSYISRANAHFINSSQTLPSTLSSAGTRFFWYPDKAAFRAGGTAGAQWSDANIGIYSAALGYDSLASGQYSFATGNSATASGNYSFGAGRTIDASGNSSVALGQNLTTSGTNSVAFGYFGVASGASSIMMGQTADATGANSFALGLGVAAGTRPVVSGARSFGIFMGDQSGRNITSDNTMELLGGKFLIDANPLFASSSILGTSLSMDVNGNVGAEQYCDSDGSYCFTAQSISSGAVGVFENASNIIRLTSGTVNYASASYVFGSPVMDDDNIDSHRTRMLFKKSNGAFRAGSTFGNQWDSANLGANSAAFGNVSVASGAGSFAAGDTAHAYGNYSVAMGYAVTASGNQGSTAFGEYSTASGATSMAFGRYVTASNVSSIAMGLGGQASGAQSGIFSFGSATGSLPNVSAANSVGFMLGNQGGVNLSSPNTFGVFGGKMVIDPASPATQFAARGVLDLGAATDAIVLPAGITGQRPGSAVNGMLRYNSTNGKFEGYQAGAWQDILTGAIAGGAAAPDRGIQFNSGNSFAAASTFIYTSAGNLGLGTASPAAKLDVVGATNISGQLQLGSSSSGSGAIKLYAFGNTFEVYNDNGYPAVTAGYFAFRAGGSNPISYYQNPITFGANALALSTVDIKGSLAVGGYANFSSAPTNGMIVSGKVGVGTSAPATLLDIAGTLKVADGGETCSVTYKGGIRFTSVNTLQYCNGTSWVSTAAGSGVMAIDDLTDAITQYSSGGSMYLGSGVGASGTGGNNTALGTNAMSSIVNLSGNTAMGVEAMRYVNNTVSVASGGNSAFGYQALRGNTSPSANTGTNNTGIGYQTLMYNTTGASNTAVGGNALYGNSSGGNNTATGQGALFINNSGNNNTATGAAAMYTNASGSGNTAIGQQSLLSNLTGNYNTATGAGALYYNSGKHESTAIGYNAMYYADSASTSVVTNNTALGAYALRGSTTAANNTGTANTAIGHSSLLGITTGSNNVALGYAAGSTTTTGASNILIGSGVTATAATTSYWLNIGNAITGDMLTGNLAINGTGALTLPVGVNGTRPGAPVNGMLRYNSASGKFEGYQAGSWQDILTTGVSGGAAAPDRGIQFNSGNNFAATSSFVYSSAGALLMTGTYVGVPFMPTSGAGARMIFDPNSGAFKAGAVTGNKWDNANTGNFSAAFGLDTQVKGNYSVGMGQINIINGDASVGLGYNNVVSANSGVALGASGTVSGTNGIAIGGGNTASGLNSVAIGNVATASGVDAIAIGTKLTVGNGVAASGLGDFSLGWGLGNAAGTAPSITGVSSLGIFMGDQSALVMASSNTMGLYGGKFVIDPAVPSTYTYPRTALDVNGSIKVGDGGETCATLVKGAIRYTSVNTLQYCNGTSWTSTAAGTGLMAVDDLTDAITNYTGSASASTNSIQSMFIGSGSGVLANTSAGYNTAIGVGSMVALTGGSSNTAVGYRTLYTLNTGTNNTAVGYAAMRLNDTGSYNAAFGYGVLANNTNGINNTGVGTGTLSANTTGTGNTGNGYGALFSNVAKQESTAVGYSAMYYADSSATAGVTYNTAIGTYALRGSVTAASNTGTGNTAVGHNSLKNVSSGSGNLGVGASTGLTLATGSRNLLFGSSVDVPSASTSDYLSIGNLIFGSGGMGTGTTVGTGFVGIRTATPRVSLDVVGTDALMIPAGNNSTNRPTGGNVANGMIRYNTTDTRFEGYQNGSWMPFSSGGSAAVVSIDDLTDAATNYTGSVTASSNSVYSMFFGTGVGATATAGAARNNSLGYLSLASLTTGTDNAVMGNNAGQFISTGSYNVAIGSSALMGVTGNKLTGDNNVAIGRLAMSSSQGVAAYNVAIGERALANNTIGDSNTAVGQQTLTTNVSGQESTAIGQYAMANANSAGGAVFPTYNTAVGNAALAGSIVPANNTGLYNTALGHSSMIANTSGTQNTAVGALSLNNNTTGNYNTVLGVQAGTGNYSGNNNIAIGVNALYANVGKSESVAVGYGAMQYADNTATASISYNTGVGSYALQGSGTPGNNTGKYNTAFGHTALTSVTGGSSNTGVGFGAGASITSGANNTLMGAGAGATITTGSGNLIFGSGINTPATGTSNFMSIGNLIFASGGFGVDTAVGTGFVGIRTATPRVSLDVVGTDALMLPAGNNSTNRPTGGNLANGMIRYNTTDTRFEGYQNGSWLPFSSAIPGATSAGGATTQVQFNSGGVLGASANFVYDVTNNIFTIANSGTGSIRTGAGTAFLPSLSFAADTDTGLYNSGANSLDVSAGGGRVVQFTSVSTGVNYLTMAGAATGASPTISNGGSDTNGAGLGLNITGKAATAAGAGGPLVFTAGAGNGAGAGGANSLVAGAGGATGAGGAVTITTGAGGSTSGGSGTLTIGTGTTTSGTIGSILAKLGATTYMTIQPPSTTSASVVFGGTDAVTLPAGTQGQRPSVGVNGMIRYNSTDGRFEGYQVGSWLPFSSGGAASTLAIDGLTDAKTDYVTDFNLMIGTPADAWAIAATGQYNLTLGQLAGDSITTGDNNLAIGYNALTAVTTSNYNLAIGKDALKATTSGANNLGIGDNTLGANTVGYANVAIGRNNMSTNVGGSETTAIGYNAMLYANSVAGATATLNTALGAYALQGSTTASANTGTNNTAIGHSALLADTSGYKNTAVGHNALVANTSGQFNTALGQGVLSGNVSGVDNTGVGVTALQYTSGDGNTAVGVNAIQSIVGVPLTGTENTAIGKTALQNIQGFTNYNVAVGSSAGSNITTGSSNIMIGYDVDAQSITGSNQLSIGNVIFASGGFGTGTTVGNGKVGIRTASPRVAFDITGTDAIMIPAGNNSTNRPTGGNLANGMMRYNTTDTRFEGYQNGAWLPFSSGGAASTLELDDLTDVATNYTGTASASTNSTQSMFLGTGAGSSAAVGASRNIAIGYYSVNALTTAVDNIAIGYAAGQYVTTGQSNISIGTNALTGIVGTPLTGGFNVAIGQGALNKAQGVAAYNVAVGQNSLTNNTIGDSNTAIGQNTLVTNVSGKESTAIGQYAMANANSAGGAVFATYNTAVGNAALAGSATPANNTGKYNTAIGHSSVNGITSGSYNTGIGAYALTGVTTGSSNIAFGSGSAQNLTTGSSNIFIGPAINSPAVGTSNYMSIGNLIYASGGFGTGTTVGTGFVGIRTSLPRVSLDVVGTDAIMIPAGNNSTNRPTGGNLANGMMRYNTTDTRFEGYQNGAWLPFSSATAGAVTAAGSNLQVQYNNGGVLGASSTMTFTSSTNTLAVTGIVSVSDRINITGTSGLTAPTGIALSNLSDVALGTLATGKVLTYNGTAWAATTPVSGVAGSTTQIQYNNAGALAGSGNFTWTNASSLLTVTGDISYSGVLTDTSDRRLKTDIAPLSDKGSMLDKLGQLGTYSYHLKRDLNTTQYGVIAQEIKEVFPELVRTDENSPEKYLSVNYTGLIAPLIEASKELKAENDNLKTQVAQMKSEREEIQASLQDLQKDIKGLKVRTGYGIDKAGIDGWMLLLIGVIFGGGSVMFFFGGMVRAQRGNRE